MRDSWKTVAFADAVEDVSGGNMKTPQTEVRLEGRFPVVDQGKELIAGYIDEEERRCRAELPVIVFGDHTRCFKYVDFPFCIGADGVKVLRPKAGLEARYLFHFFRQIHLTEGGYDRHFKYLKRSEIVVPPISKQRRIAEILDQADALRAKRRAALAQVDRLTQAIFLEMFGDPATNPKQMPREPLGALIKVKSGEFLPASSMTSGGTYAVLGGNGVNGYHDKFLFEERQVVIGRVGVYCGCVHVSPPRSWITDNALYVADRSERLDFDYLSYALIHAKLNQYASQSGQPLVSGSRIYPVEILVPPLELQRSFALRAAAVDKLKAAHRASLAQLDALFASLQHRAFRGEL